MLQRLDYLYSKKSFSTKLISDGNDEIRKKISMPIQFGSCRTAVIEGYTIEDYVPAWGNWRLLTEKLKATGIAVPAMPINLSGMDSPEYGSRKNPYDVY